MRRRPRIFAAVASVTCLLITIALWAFCHIASGRTAIGVGLGWRWMGDESHPMCGAYLYTPDDREHELWYLRTVLPPYIPHLGVVLSHRPFQVLGFQYIYYHATPTDRYSAVGVPFWFLTVFTAFMSYRFGRPLLLRPPPGTCKHCGYDLRATPDRCPECGHSVRPILARH